VKFVLIQQIRRLRDHTQSHTLFDEKLAIQSEVYVLQARGPQAVRVHRGAPRPVLVRRIFPVRELDDRSGEDIRVKIQIPVCRRCDGPADAPYCMCQAVTASNCRCVPPHCGTRKPAAEIARRVRCSLAARYRAGRSLGSVGTRPACQTCEGRQGIDRGADLETHSIRGNPARPTYQAWQAEAAFVARELPSRRGSACPPFPFCANHGPLSEVRITSGLPSIFNSRRVRNTLPTLQSSS